MCFLVPFYPLNTATLPSFHFRDTSNPEQQVFYIEAKNTAKQPKYGKCYLE